MVLGAIPGIGGAPSAFLSYSEAKRTSPNQKANFGKGEIEGVAAAEAGNNGVAGSTLIPLLALGVPGDIITAIILGAFMIHGLRPGPLMFQENINLIYALFMGIMLSSAYLFIVGKASIRIISKIADVPHRILYPVVLVLCMFGAYAVNNTIFDVLVMFIMGVVGFTMLKLEVPGGAVPDRVHSGAVAGRQFPAIAAVVGGRPVGLLQKRHLLGFLGADDACYCIRGLSEGKRENARACPRVVVASGMTSPDQEEPLFTFAIVTDTHIRPPGGDESSPFRRQRSGERPRPLRRSRPSPGMRPTSPFTLATWCIRCRTCRPTDRRRRRLCRFSSPCASRCISCRATMTSATSRWRARPPARWMRKAYPRSTRNISAPRHTASTTTACMWL